MIVLNILLLTLILYSNTYIQVFLYCHSCNSFECQLYQFNESTVCQQHSFLVYNLLNLCIGLLSDFWKQMLPYLFFEHSQHTIFNSQKDENIN